MKPAASRPRADGADHAVQHAAGGDHVGAGLGMADALLRQQRQRGVVVHVEPAAVLVQDAAMAVVGVLAEAFVRHEQHAVAERLPQRPQRLLHDAFVVQGAGAGGVLVRGDAEQDEGADAEVDGGADLLHQPIDAELVVARHRGDFFLDAAARAGRTAAG